MDNLFAYIRPALSAVFPFIFLHYFAHYFYQLSLLDIARWWFSNFSKVNSAGAYVMGLFFAWLVLAMSFSAFMNTFYLSVVGNNQELVYLGHDKENSASYYRLHDFNKQVITGYDAETPYNFSFNTLYRSQMFKADPLMPDSIGTKSSSFSFIAFISVILSLVTFTLMFLPVFNVLVHMVYKTMPTPVNIPTEGASLAFEYIIGRYHISKAVYFVMIPILLFSWMGSVVAMSKNTVSDPVLLLPSYIQPGATITAFPVEMSIRYERRERSTKKNDYITEDSGDRYINMRFERGFKHPVYVAAIINVNTHAAQLAEIERKVRQKQPFDVLVNDDLGISIIYDARLNNSN